MLRIGAEMAIAGALTMMRTCVGADAQPIAACFDYPAPAHRAEYERIFGAALRFDHAYTGLDFDRAWLDRPMPHANPRLFAVMEAQAQLALERLDEGAELGGRVQAHLATLEPCKMPTMEEVARHFGMSARTMRRRLSAEGVEYRALVEGARAAIARALLRQPRSTIQEVAFAMGFATPEAFHRAFRRWYGTTPGRFRTGD
jgi:AraC-like DNA-binding protein